MSSTTSSSPCSRGAPPRPARRAERQEQQMPLASFEPAELGPFTRAFEDFFDQEDPESMTSYYTENAQLMADGIQPVRGHGAIGRFWCEAIARASAAGARPP